MKKALLTLFLIAPAFAAAAAAPVCNTLACCRANPQAVTPTGTPCSAVLKGKPTKDQRLVAAPAVSTSKPAAKAVVKSKSNISNN